MGTETFTLLQILMTTPSDDLEVVARRELSALIEERYREERELTRTSSGRTDYNEGVLSGLTFAFRVVRASTVPLRPLSSMLNGADVKTAAKIAVEQCAEALLAPGDHHSIGCDQRPVFTELYGPGKCNCDMQAAAQLLRGKTDE